MTISQSEAKTIVKENLNDFLENYMGRDLIRQGNSYITNCINPEHADNHPSMSVATGKEGLPYYHCFSCGASGDTFNAIGIAYNLDNFRSQAMKAYDIYGLDVENSIAKEFVIEQKPNKTLQNTITEEQIEALKMNFQENLKVYVNNLSKSPYLENRGISEETAKSLNVGYDERDNSIIFPTSDLTFSSRKIDADQKERYKKSKNVIDDQRANFFGYEEALNSAGDVVYIVEGEIDALSIYEAGGQAIALGGVTLATQFYNRLEGDKRKQNKTFIVALDNDEAGDRASDVLAGKLHKGQISQYKLNIYQGYKDANDMLKADREQLEANISMLKTKEGRDAFLQEQKRKAYEAKSASSKLQAFIDGIADSINTPVVSTGFNGLDNALDGGFYEGLYILGAVSSLGKTTFILQIADQIAESGQDVLIFSLEMAESELMAKSISRNTIKEVIARNGDSKNAKTSRGITSGARYAFYNAEEHDIIEKATNKYATYANNIYIVEGMGNVGYEVIRDRVKEHIDATGKHPIVIVDYFQILAPSNERATDKQNIDKNVTELKRVSRDFKVPVVAISSFNRQNYNNKVTMEAFKESGAIEYSADILMGLQFKGIGDNGFSALEARRKDPREIEVVILKNRNGAIPDAIPYKYYPMFNYFTED